MLRKNICSQCKYQFDCISYRYNNKPLKYMKKYTKEMTKDGQIVIYVNECERFTKRKFKYTLDN